VAMDETDSGEVKKEIASRSAARNRGLRRDGRQLPESLIWF